MEGRATAGLRSKPLAIRVMGSWNMLPEVLELGSVREFQGRLDDAWLSIFEEDSL